MQQLLKAGWSLEFIWIATVALYLLLYTTLGIREQRIAACEQQQLATAAGLKSSTPCSVASFSHVLQSAVLGGSLTVMLAVLVVLWVCEVMAWLGVGVRSTPAQRSNVQAQPLPSKLGHLSCDSTWTGLTSPSGAATATKGPGSKQQPAAGQHACMDLEGQHTGDPGQDQQLYSNVAERAATHVQLPMTAVQESCSNWLAGAGQAVPAAQHALQQQQQQQQQQHPGVCFAAADSVSTATAPWAGHLGTSDICDAGVDDDCLVSFCCAIPCL
jgi:hypothetical protein